MKHRSKASCGEKSYVALGVCPICQQENGEIIMDTKLRDRFCRHVMTPDACDECKEKYLSQGVLLIAPESNRIAVVTDDAFKQAFTVPIPEKKTCFVEERVMDLILPLGAEVPEP